jgi:DNA/RNA endonuclease YhcR with UshA esterase domain
MLTSSMNNHGVVKIHGVIKITVEAECDNKTYGSRTICIETETGTIEITLFSKRQEEDDDKPYMPFVI